MPGEKERAKLRFEKEAKRSGGGGGGGKQRRGPRPERAKPEFDQKIIDIRRVARVVTGGRRFSFSVAVVAGDRKGRVGIGTGKAGDTSLAIEKAFKNAKKNMVKVKLTKNMSIPHEVEIKLNSARLMLLPAPGRGIVAGSSVRTVLDLFRGQGCWRKDLFTQQKQAQQRARSCFKHSKFLKYKLLVHANSSITTKYTKQKKSACWPWRQAWQDFRTRHQRPKSACRREIAS